MLLLFSLLSTLATDAQWLGPPTTNAHRIVSLAPSITEILFALDMGDRVVGVTRFDDFPPEVKDLPKVGGFIDADPEAVLALKPDLIIGLRTSGGRGAVDTLARLGLPVLIVPAETVADLWTAIAAVGRASGRVPAARDLTERLQADLAELRRARQHAPRLRVLLAVGHRPLVAAGPGTYLEELLTVLAADNVITSGGPYPHLDLEAVVALDPDAIIDVAFAPATGKQWDRFRAVRAVREGHIVRVPGSALLRLGPRLPQGLSSLGDALQSIEP